MDPLKRQIFRDAFAQIFSLILRPCHIVLIQIWHIEQHYLQVVHEIEVGHEQKILHVGVNQFVVFLLCLDGVGRAGDGRCVILPDIFRIVLFVGSSVDYLLLGF